VIELLEGGNLLERCVQQTRHAGSQCSHGNNSNFRLRHLAIGADPASSAEQTQPRVSEPRALARYLTDMPGCSVSSTSRIFAARGRFYSVLCLALD